MKVIIAGSRSLGLRNQDIALVIQAIAESGFDVTEVVCGMANGADMMGYYWAKGAGISVKEFPANWEKFGKKAGFMRNQEMADYVWPDGGLILLWDGKSKGSKHMKDIAANCNLQTHIHIVESIMYKPENDGIDHLNIYTKAKTTIGMLLTNFSRSAVDTPWGRFQSVEGYWFWLKALPSPERDKLKAMANYEAKKFGRELPQNPKFNEQKFQQLIKDSLHSKVANNKMIRKLLVESELPFDHYYVSDKGERVNAGYEWITAEWEIIRRNLKAQGENYEQGA